MIAALLLAAAAALPLSPQPAPPFPAIASDAPVFGEVAPGIRYGDYRMLTAEGPLSVHVLSVDLRNPYVRVGTALAQDRLVSSGETVSSMAARTGAVAGINGDYFDINQTNQPLNILVENGKLLRMPMHRWALAFDKQQVPQFDEFQVTAQAVLGEQTIPLKTINDWPPPGGGTVFVTPDYGSLHPAENVTTYALQPVDGTPPFATYRVTGIADNGTALNPGYYFAFGPQAYGTFPLPSAGDTIAIQGSAQPSLQDLVSAIGGGPLLVKDGTWYADPDGPNHGEFRTNMPATAAGVAADGSLLLFEVDGRQPSRSIGLLQPQLASLMIAFGVVTGMQFDGGGSSTMVARLPGDDAAVVQNSPSDGVERRIADALLVYSDAPAGPPAKIVATPQTIRALPGARVPLQIAVTDASDRTVHVSPGAIAMRVIPAAAGRIDGDTFVAGNTPQDAVVRVQSGSLAADVPVHVTGAVARAEILPEHPALQPHERLRFSAQAFDASGYLIAVPQVLHWRASGGTIDENGTFAAADRDAGVSVMLGDKRVSEAVTVGEHAQPVPLANATFATAPRGGPGSLEPSATCPQCLTLRYDFSGKERAAYIDDTVRLPERALGLSAQVYGDGNGEILRLSVDNAINERFWYTFAKVDWHGWRRVEFRFPPELPQPITLKQIYVIDRVGPGAPVTAAGAIDVRGVQVLLAGSSHDAPK